MAARRIFNRHGLQFLHRAHQFASQLGGPFCGDVLGLLLRAA